MTDILTLDEARSAVNLSGQTAQDSQLGLFVSGISGRVDDLCGPVVIRTLVEPHDGGGARIWLHESPVDSVTSVVEWLHTTSNTLTAETNSVKPANGYLLDHIGKAAVLYRRTGGSDTRFHQGRRNIVVTYKPGRYEDTASVDAKFKLAVTSILRRVWKREQAAWAQTPDFFPSVDDPGSADRFRGFFRAFDPVIKELLADELKAPEVA